MIPIASLLSGGLWKAGAIAAVAAGLWLHGCSVGQDGEREKREALQRSYEVAAAAAAAREAEKVRVRDNAVKVAGEKYAQANAINSASYDARVARLRDAAATRDRVRSATESAGTSCQTSAGTSAELLGYGEAVARLAREATADRSALIACYEAFPR